MDRIVPDAYTPDPSARLDVAAVDAGNAMPQLPDADEARAWIMVKCEGRQQADVAAMLGVTQGAVSKMVARAGRKIDELVRLRWITRDQLERNIRRAVGLAPRT